MSSDGDRSECLLCDGPTAPWMTVPGDWRRPDHRDGYLLRWCRGCGFGQVDPRPRVDEIPGFYQLDSYYTHGRNSPGAAPETVGLVDRVRIKLAWNNDHSVNMNESWMRGRLNPGARVCDLGCGSGAFASRLNRLGYKVVGVEPDPIAREFARGEGLVVFPGTAEELPDEIRAERYDCVVMSHALEHCLDPKRAAANAASLLADQGLLIIETPNNEAKSLLRAGVLWPWLDVPRHLNFFTRRSLQLICENIGLAVRAVEYRGYVEQFTTDWIATERRIHEVFAAGAGRPGTDDPRSDAWALLLSTLWSPERLKYHSVRVTAGKPA